MAIAAAAIIGGATLASAYMGSKSAKKAGKASPEAQRLAGAEANLKEGQLSFANEIANLLSNPANFQKQGVQIPGKAGGGLSMEELSRIASMVPPEVLLAIPGLFGTGTGGTQSLEATSRSGNLLQAQQQGEASESLGRLIAILLAGNQNPETTSNPFTVGSTSQGFM